MEDCEQSKEILDIPAVSLIANCSTHLKCDIIKLLSDNNVIIIAFYVTHQKYLKRGRTSFNGFFLLISKQEAAIVVQESK
jgi:hypothetical protein